MITTVQPMMEPLSPKQSNSPSIIEYIDPDRKSGGGFLMDITNAKEELGYEPVYDVHKLFENYKEENDEDNQTGG